MEDIDMTEVRGIEQCKITISAQPSSMRFGLALSVDMLVLTEVLTQSNQSKDHWQGKQSLYIVA
jgi:hypothetical protein